MFSLPLSPILLDIGMDIVSSKSLMRLIFLGKAKLGYDVYNCYSASFGSSGCKKQEPSPLVQDTLAS